MGNMETVLVVMVALSMTGLFVVGFAGWWLDGVIHGEAEVLQRQAEGLKEQADEQSSRLASLGAEVHHARAELARVHGEVALLRAELGTFVHGPPSMRTPPIVPAEKTS